MIGKLRFCSLVDEKHNLMVLTNIIRRKWVLVCEGLENIEEALISRYYATYFIT